MCGRFSMSITPDQLRTYVENVNLALDEIRNGQQATISHNIGPTKHGAVYRTDINPHEGGADEANIENQGNERAHPVTSPRIVQYMKWGLVPSYFKDQSQGGKMFNCRAESLAEGRPVWSGPKKHNRCLVFMEGYYEWEKEGKNKIPYYVKRKDGKLMCMAGLWDRNDKGGDELFSFTIITTHADEGIKWLHERMPVIVEPTDELINTWLDPNLIWKENSKMFEKLIKPYPTSKLEIYEVSQEVNKIGRDSEKMNLPVKVSAKKGPASAFFQIKKRGPSKEKVKEDSESGDVKDSKEDIKKDSDGGVGKDRVGEVKKEENEDEGIEENEDKSSKEESKYIDKKDNNGIKEEQNSQTAEDNAEHELESKSQVSKPPSKKQKLTPKNPPGTNEDAPSRRTRSHN